MLAPPPFFVVKMRGMCSLDVLETARVAFGFSKPICKRMSARYFAAIVVLLERTRWVEHALDGATDAG